MRFLDSFRLRVVQLIIVGDIVLRLVQEITVASRMAEAAKRRAVELVDHLSELQLLDTCNNHNLTIKSDLKVSRKQALKNKLLRHIHSEDLEESADGGLEFFQNVTKEMVDMIQADGASGADSDALKKLLQSPQPKVTDPVVDSEGLIDGEAEKLQQVLQNLGLSSGAPRQVVIGALASLLKTEKDGGLDEDAMKELGQEVGNVVKQTQSGSTSGGSHSKTTENQATRSRVVHRLKEFKIDGKIGHGDSPLTFQNIKYQIADAENLEYQWKEIMSALIKAMKSGSSIRNYFETNPELEKSEFLEMLESLLDEEKESSDLVLEMKSKVQKTDEKVEDYVLDMVNLKEQIVKESVKEGSPVGEDLAWKWCSQAILEGLRHDAIRQEMRTILRKTLNKPALMKEVKQLVKLEAQHCLKTGEEDASSTNQKGAKSDRKTNVNVNQVTPPRSVVGNQSMYGDKKSTLRMKQTMVIRATLK